MEEKRKLLGIIGGLGPMSSAYFYELITEHTKAFRDQDHIDIILSSRATTPDRTDYILGKSTESPLPAMIEDARSLERYGATAIVIPCNTAHYFIEEVRNSVCVPMPSIITETVLHLKRRGFKKAAILATDGTISTETYQRELAVHGLDYAIPDEDGRKTLMKLIYEDVKSGRIPAPKELYTVTDPLFEAGCDCTILGCTELSLIGKYIDDPRFVDSLEALAYTAIELMGHESIGFPSYFEDKEA